MNIYTFKLYNSDFLELGSFNYVNDKIDQDVFNKGMFTFSPDGHYLALLFNTYFLGIAHFPDGFEHDLFLEPSVGHQALDLLFTNSM